MTNSAEANLMSTNLTMPEATKYALDLLGANGGVAIGEVTDSANLRWANSSLTTNGNVVEQSLSVASFLPVENGTAVGIASGQISDRFSIEQLVAKSVASAIAAGVAEDANPLPEGLVHQDFDLVPAMTNLNELEHISAGLGQVMTNVEVGYFGYAEITTDTLYVATSAGLRQRFEQRTSRFELCGKSTDRKRSAWSGQSGTTLLSVDVGAHTEQVNLGLAHQLTQIEIEPGKHDVILSSSAVADLMIYLMWTASAREAAEGRSVFSAVGGGTRIGDKLTIRNFSLKSDPNYPGIETVDRVLSMGSSSFSSTFDTGSSIAPVELISGGKLAALGSSRHTANVSKLPFTPLADNIIVTDKDGAGNLTDLAQRMKNGLLVTCLWYIREVDPQSLLLTGLTRDGVYVVKDGQIIGAASNFRFNESPVGMLERIKDAGAATPCLAREWADYFSRAVVAPLTIEGFNLSTKSDAV